MAKTFQGAETIVCSIQVKNASSVLANPATSMNVEIVGPTGTTIVTSTPMTNDGVGLYHYDHQPAADAAKGRYYVRYTATDGTRVTIEDDSFLLE